ncbi:hypothetical protein [Nocardioides bruguierae]|uniref:Uncharacterized protein n=1 Tax=Nocardioides bruguierae TaxID=2945102 RepID=A0A9X2DBL1_9ACTN|nr:hypothetical protein [Nocardioides bruguierae]MCM0622609.1 hypothetical protein [Nocardioides bruguierae]
MTTTHPDVLEPYIEDDATEQHEKPEVVDFDELIREGAAGIDQARATLITHVVRARRAGRSWAGIAAPLGITRQAAWERFHGHVDHAERLLGPADPDTTENPATGPAASRQSSTTDQREEGSGA